MFELERLVEAMGELLDEHFERVLDELVPAVARELAGLAGLPARREPLVGVKATAAYLGVNESWVYAHADELRVRRLNAHGRSTLRFSLEDVDQVLTTCTAGRGSGAAVTPLVERKQVRRRRRGAGTDVPLLPVREVHGG